MTADQLIADWRAAAAEETYFSASRVQDRLFDLYAELQHLPGGRLVERWLSLTIQREMFSSAELLDMLDELQSQRMDPVSAG